jgi:transposase
MNTAAIASIGIDLGKTTFHLVALDCHAGVIVRKKFSSSQLLTYTANLPWSLIGMEACSGAHFLAAKLREQGHEVKLIPAQFVKPYRKSNKNDFIDAEAIAEAVTRHNMRFVPIKTDDQLDLQALHRVRERLVRRRTALINQIRGFLLERGLVFAQRPANLRRQLPLVLEDADAHLTPYFRRLLNDLWQEWKQVQANIASLDEEMEQISSADAACERLRTIPGVAPWSRPLSWPPSATVRRSATDASSPRGWAWCHGSTRREAERNCSVSANAGMLTCDACSSTALAPCCGE